MSNVISLTVPRDDEAALVAGATMLLTLAGKIPAMELPAVRDAGDLTRSELGPRIAPETACNVLQRLPYQVEKGVSACLQWPRCENCELPIHHELAMRAYTDDASRVKMEWVPGPTEPDDDGEPIRPIEEKEKAVGPELDADGLPWDARIHSGSKAKLQDGTWRKKRGVDQADYDRIVEELKQLMAVPVVETEVYSEEQTEEIKEALESEPSFVPPPPAPAPAAEQQDAVAPPPPPAPTADEPVPETFPQFLKAITAKINAKELTMDQVNAALPEGVVNLQALGANRPDLIPSVWAKLP